MTIFVALSGGVDSSVAATLLQKEGHTVRGVYLKVWSSELEDVMGECPWEEDVRNVEAVGKHLQIPVEVWDISKEYFDTVVSYFVREYAEGRTPNPDILCNREMKFGLFLRRARERGAEKIATGHYARLQSSVERLKIKVDSKNKKTKGFQLSTFNFQLLQAKDKNKDQSYFLYSLTQEQLQYALFPIGEYTKQEVRVMARKFGLPNAERKDSQGVCFIGKIPVQTFLKMRIPERRGELVTTTGEVVGEHEGAAYYTIGQRHGIGSPGGGVPYFVVEKDLATNRVVVGRGQDDAALYRKEAFLENVHWIAGEPPILPLTCLARIRYRQPLQDCIISSTPGVEFDVPQRAITPGQACVFYDGEHLLGGGIIAEKGSGN